ncbi:MAG: hypothetical protein JW854_04815 [Actinobacteria bacterium]|nr:hypothetical protein [Actinomycetota bacterium]
MKKATAFLIGLVLLLLVPAFVSGCGGGEQQFPDEELAVYALENILVPEQRDADFIVMWMRQATAVSEASPDVLGLRFWKWEGGSLSEITLEEYEELAAQRVGGNPNDWTYSQHSITVLEIDGDNGEAVVEIGSLYNPYAGSGVRYLLRKEGDEWTKVSESTVWGS